MGYPKQIPDGHYNRIPSLVVPGPGFPGICTVVHMLRNSSTSACCSSLAVAVTFTQLTLSEQLSEIMSLAMPK